MTELVVNPFVSEAQRAWMFANEPAMAKRWAKHTPKKRRLPPRRHPVTNGRIARIDPSRTITLRRQFAAELAKRFNLLRREIVNLVLRDDALGLRRRQKFVLHYDPDQPRDEKGQWTSTITSNDVGKILEKQYVNQKASKENILGYNPETNEPIYSIGKERFESAFLQDKWVTSKTFHLHEIPIDSVSPTADIHTLTETHSSGPIIVDVNPGGYGRLHGMFGAPPRVIILDGKHRYASAKSRGEKTIQAYVGSEALVHVGQIRNAFCPTGEGGGVDPTCSPGSGSSGLPNRVREAFAKATAVLSDKYRIEVQRDGDWDILHFKLSGETRTEQTIAVKIASNGDVYLADVYVPNLLRGKGLLTSALSDIRKQPGVSGILRVSVGMDVKGWDNIARRAGFKREPVVNAFCPTGPGGGQDNSCSPGGVKLPEHERQYISDMFDDLGTVEQVEKLSMPIREGVKSGNPSAGFGACTVLSLIEYKKNGGSLYVGYVADKGKYDESVRRHTPEDWSFMSEAVPHAWNVQDGVIVDRALGSDDAKTKVYLGRRVPDGKLRSMTDDKQLARWKSLFAGVENAFCPTGEGGGVDPSCSPGGRAATKTPEFKRWFSKSKVVDEKGEPMTMYHGTRSDFSQFKTDTADEGWGMLDRVLGSHFAEDPSVTSAFSTGEYSRLRGDYHIDAFEPQNSWYRDPSTGKVVYGTDKDFNAIAVIKKGDTGEVEPYNVEKHGSTYGIREKFGADTELYMIKGGGRTLPVHLSISNPLVVDPPGREMDQTSIHKAVVSAVVPHNRQLFVDAVSQAGYGSKEVAGEMWDSFKAEKPYKSGSEYGNYANLEAFINDRGSTLFSNGAHAREAKATLQKLGYDGIKYRNTSGNEVKEKANPWAWIAFNPTQIKSATGNKGAFDPNDPIITHAEGRWQFHSTEQKLTAFREWLKRQILLHVVGEYLDEHAWWNRYIMEGFRKGAARAFDDTRPQVRAAMGRDQEAVRDFYAGTKDEFLRSSFNLPVPREKVKILASRTFTDLKGVTDGMAAKISHSLVDGLIKGDNPRAIARELAKAVDFSRARAETVSRTEIIRCHAEGQLDAFERLGVTEVGVMAEWATAHDARVCPLCRPLDGMVMKVGEATGLLPRHPNAVFAGSTFASYGKCEELVRAWYRGPAVILVIGAGRHRTTIGPNHPVLTWRGMVPAAQLQKGDKILYDTRGDLSSHSCNIKEMPTVENVFASSVAVLGNSGIVSSASDLHGDRVFCQGEVQAIRPAGSLLFVFDSCGVEQLRQSDFTRPNPQTHLGASLGSHNLSLESILLSSASSVSSNRALAVGQDSFDPHSDQPFVDYAAVNTQSFRDGALRFSGQVSLPNFFEWKRVHEISFGEYEGLAFDATTATSLYYSGGLVVSNCRCAWLPANVGEDESKQKRGKSNIAGAINDSYRAELPKRTKRTLAQQKTRSTWGGADKTIARVRPTSVFNPTHNVFCPTGKGGGVDPSCSPTSSARDFVEGVSLTSSATPQSLDVFTRKELKKTVAKGEYTVYRGIGIIKERVSKDEMTQLRSLKKGDPAPSWITERRHGTSVKPFNSWTTSESVAKRYKEGSVEIVLKGIAPRDVVVADLSNLRGIPGFDKDLVHYGKIEHEIIIEGPVSAIIHSIKK
jgi:SPP1 gp7 family putative phage head morphogenesis protein